MSDPGPIDRNLQRSLLMSMRDAYPQSVDQFPESSDQPFKVLANVAYLIEHGLCAGKLHESMAGIDGFFGATITAAGLDFLADDGGLSAILSVVTVRLHADTVRDLIASKIDASPLPAEKKAGLRATLAKLPAVALQEGSKRLIGLGIDHIGDVEAWLHHLPGVLGL